MTIDRRTLRWNGWGKIEGPDMLRGKDAEIWSWIGRKIGADPLPVTPSKAFGEINPGPARLSAAAIDKLAAITAPDQVKTDDYERVFHARGRSYHDLLYLRAGRIDTAPDAVVYPVSAGEVLALVQFAVASNIAIVPFGGGSSVVGGVTAQSGPHHAGVITLDMTLMNRLLAIDETAMVARAEAGIYGPALEEALRAKGYTLSHYPQSFEYSTLGGWIASRSAGHQSNKYGKAEHWLVSAEMATPGGIWRSEGFPGSAAGPQVRDIIAGAEGALGIITEAEFRVHRVPEAMDYRAFIFPGFDKGLEATRQLMQAGVPTAMIRLSDANETYFYNALHAGGADADGPVQFCLMIVGAEGGREEVDAVQAACHAVAGPLGGIHMGEHFGQTWYKGRFEMPYLRDPMMDRGLGIDTLETATRWSNIQHLHDVVSKVLDEAIVAYPGLPGAGGISMSHVSHCYRDGASLYFTFVFLRDQDRDVEQWLAIKKAVSDAIVANGGTISHHHGIGTDHLPWMDKEKGPVGASVLRAIKDRIDPGGILNPGKLFSMKP